MIRNALFLTTLIGVSTLAQAQQKSTAVQVILAKDTALYGISPAQLAKTHLPSREAIKRLSKTRQAAAKAILEEYHQDHFSGRTAYRALPRVSFTSQEQAYFRADGTAEWVVISFQPANNAELGQHILSTAKAFYEQTPLKLNLSTPFSIEAGGSTVVSQNTPKRSASNGYGTIGTIEMAERTTRPDTVKSLFFHDLNLTTVPDVVYRFPNLEELTLSWNALTSLPARLTADLPKLKRLDLAYNLLKEDSVFFAQNTHLEALSLTDNRLRDIPASVALNQQLISLGISGNRVKVLTTNALSGLSTLKILNLSNNRLAQLPATIGRLTRLTALNLDDNSLTRLPKQIGQLKALARLTVVNNKLASLPNELTGLTNLTTLLIFHNQLRQLPADLPRLTHLRLLDMNTNEFTQVPAVVMALPALEELDISSNNLKTLPAKLAQLPTLKTLYMRNNPVTIGDAKAGRYARVIDQLEANKTEVFY